MLRNTLLFLFALWSGLSWATEGTVMVTRVEGDVSLFSEGQPPVTVTPFLRLRTGDLLRLSREGKISLIYTHQGRQENWWGKGSLRIEEAESRVATGSPVLETRQLPTQVALQISRTPTMDASGKVGMVRVRAIPSPDALAKLEKQYQELRSQTASSDRAPEIFFLAGLFEIRELDRLRQELQNIRSHYPTDPEMKLLGKLYARAVEDLRQAQP